MPKTIIENQFLRQFRKLSPVGRGEVFEYARWLLDVERQEGLSRLIDRESKSHTNDSCECRKRRRLILFFRKAPYIENTAKKT